MFSLVRTDFSILRVGTIILGSLRRTSEPLLHPSVAALVRRWLELFAAHGVARHQIPGLLQGHRLPLSQLSEDRAAADLLTNDVREATCRLFDVERAWLDGDSARIYSPGLSIQSEAAARAQTRRIMLLGRRRRRPTDGVDAEVT